MISKDDNGKLNNMNISQADEYIARCHQKRHWASNVLPGKGPLNPEHNTVLSGNVAIKKVLDGTEILSFKFRDNPRVRVRCSVYDCDADGHHLVGEDIVLM